MGAVFDSLINRASAQGIRTFNDAFRALSSSGVELFGSLWDQSISGDNLYDCDAVIFLLEQLAGDGII